MSARKTVKKATRATKAAPPKKESSRKAAGASLLLVKLPALNANDRAGFLGQFEDADCMLEGERTKSLAVRNGALGWAAEALPVLTNAALADDVDYSDKRLAWVLELVVELDAARDAQSGSGQSQGTVRTTRDLAREKAAALRGRLVSKLLRAVPTATPARITLDAARAAARSDEAVADSLTTLANLIGALLAQSDPAILARLESAKVRQSDADNAHDAADALSEAREELTLGGRARGDRDAPAVNVVEGRLTKELRLLEDAFAEARGRGVAVPALIVPRGLQHVLGRRAVRGAGDAAGLESGTGEVDATAAKAGTTPTRPARRVRVGARHRGR